MSTKCRCFYLGILVVALSFMTFASVCAQPAVTICLMESVCIGKDVVTLGDLAEITVSDGLYDVSKLEQIVICGGPQPGGVRTVNSRYVQTRLFQAGFKQGSFQLCGADIVMIYAPQSTLSIDDFKKALENAVYERLREQGLDTSDVLVEIVTTLFEINLPEGDVEFVFDVPSVLKGGTYNSIKSSIFVNGQLYSAKIVTVKIRMFQDMLVAKRRISMYEILYEHDFSLERREVSGTISTPFVQKILPGTLRASKTILEGKVLIENMVEPIPDAFADEMVTIQVTIGCVCVEAVGVLLSDARIGDSAFVRNVDTGAIVSGILVQKDLVSIK